MVKYPVSPLLNQFSNFSTIGQWNSSIREAVNHGYAHKALTLFRQMKQNGMEPNNWTFPFLAKACAKISNLKCSQIIHTHVMKSPFWSDIFVQTAMVDMYVKCNQLNDAYNLFVRMSMRDIASWNAILVGFAQSGFLDRVSCLLHDMRFAGIQPDPVTVMGLTRAVLHTKSLKLVKSLHSFSIRIGIDVDVSVANTWIAAYAKCGDLGLAEVVFNEINIDMRTVISWNSMIAGYANFLNFCGAVNSYKCLQHNGFRPDSSTIVSILSSCVQPEALFQGDMNEALTLFNAMEAAGDKPDLVTMLSLISGCGQIGALELGKWIDNYSISNGLKDNLMVAVPYAEMANIYASVGRWDRVAAIRTMMKSNKVRKSPGQSLIQVNGKIHIFTVEHRGHHEGRLIYVMLDSLHLHLKKERSQLSYGAEYELH
ncbi:pentatricopeptide repeat-containing protein At4g19191, mitochondrial-like [Fagus crenata]